jgi:hypothetical protein
MQDQLELFLKGDINFPMRSRLAGLQAQGLDSLPPGIDLCLADPLVIETSDLLGSPS